MASIGETLREARMRHRLDIADVEERTKIRAKYLRAPENEEFGMLPGSTFVKTFLRTYAEVLGLDPHVLVEEYRANYEAGEELDVQPLTPAQRGAREPRERRYSGGPPGRGTLVVGAVVAVLALLLVLGLTGGDEDGGSEQAAETSTQETTAKSKRPRPKPKPKPAASRVALEITPNGPTYICLDTGPETDRLFEGTISEVRTFKAKKIRMNLGRTAVEVKVNGKPFPIEPAAEPVGYEFSPTGSKELPPEQRPCVGV